MIHLISHFVKCKTVISSQKWQILLKVLGKITLNNSILLSYHSNKISFYEGNFINRSELEILRCKLLNTKEGISLFTGV